MKFSIDPTRLAHIQRASDTASGATVKAQDEFNHAAQYRFACRQAVERAQAQRQPAEALAKLEAELEAADAAFDLAQRELAAAHDIRTAAMRIADRVQNFVARKLP